MTFIKQVVPIRNTHFTVKPWCYVNCQVRGIHTTRVHTSWKPHCHIASLTLQSPCCLLVNILQEKLCRASWASEIWINTLWVSYDRFLMSKTPVYVVCVSFTNVLRVSVSCFIKYSKAVLPMVCVFLFHVIF